jgi:predicted Fe-Mo cluster-binding NifX family protein
MEGNGTRRMAIAMEQGRIANRFLDSDYFVFVEFSGTDVKDIKHIDASDHPSILHPWWLVQAEVDLLITGNIGKGARGFLENKGVRIITGPPPFDPEKIVQCYLTRVLSMREDR